MYIFISINYRKYFRNFKNFLYLPGINSEKKFCLYLQGIIISTYKYI